MRKVNLFAAAVSLTALFSLVAVTNNNINAVKNSNFEFLNIPQDSTTISFRMGKEIGEYLRPLAAINNNVKVVSIKSIKDTVKIYLNDNTSDYYFRDSSVSKIYQIAQSYFPGSNIKIYANNSTINELSSNFYHKEDIGEHHFTYHNKSAHKVKRVRRGKDLLTNKIVTDLSTPFVITKGLNNRHIALWQSHGYYYDQPLQRWEWQRARIFQTVEDLYTQSYVVPFLVPMLENSGAYIFLPRERDTQLNEVVVDNDSSLDGYTEQNGSSEWKEGKESGFANSQLVYADNENPFEMGTYRYAVIVRAHDVERGKTRLSAAEWIPELPKNGEYAVYVSYKSMSNSTPSANYTVKYSGGEKVFSVNQRMGGGTWIYLGTFIFDANNRNQGVYLSNIYDGKEKGNFTVSADAVKFGGGMGNIARNPSENITQNVKSSSSETPEESKTNYYVEPQTSGYPRFTEGARYWLQWAGFSLYVYSSTNFKNDYNDDYMSRGRWVNALLGGSVKSPKTHGYNIPIDMAFAFHTDAGTFLDDSIVGTLSIYTKFSNDSDKYVNNESRMWGRELADIVQTQLVKDVRAQYEPNWSRRGLWDRSYAESRTPEVPTMLLEFLSHQNFADMKYGLDPSFRFTVSRAIYKGILRFLSFKNNTDYVVQPLPVQNFSLSMNNKDDNGAVEVSLRWSPQIDSLEESANATDYLVYTRIGDEGFNNGVLVNDTTCTIHINTNEIYSFKVVAVNEGGLSFPSEILSVGIAGGKFAKNRTVMIVNGFQRIAGPASFQSKDSTIAGFYDILDHGVPYIKDWSYIGSQHEIRRNIPWMDDDAPGFGASYGDFEDKVIAGNTFDYPYSHGKAFLEEGYNFISSSVSAVECGDVKLDDFYAVDFIFGKQAQTKVGRGVKPVKYEVFPQKLRDAITSYSASGGNIIISGAYIATDLWDSYNVTEEGKKFAQEILKYKWMTHYASKTGEVKSVSNPYGFNGKFTFYNKLNDKIYVVEAPDALTPVGKGAYTIFRYADNNISAGVAYKGDYKCVSLGFPIESIKVENQRREIIREILKFFK